MISTKGINKRRNAVLAMSIVAALSAWQGCPARASLDNAAVESLYFEASHALGHKESIGAGYAKRWAGWLKMHRAIEASPALRQEYARTPVDRDSATYESRFAQLKRKVPAALLNKQSSHVYILHIGTHRSPQLTAKWVSDVWPRISEQEIYSKTPKSVYFHVFSEADSKTKSLYVLPGSPQSAQRVCYGLYASRADAARDASKLKPYLRTQPNILQRPLNAELAGAYSYGNFSGGVRPERRYHG